MQARGRAHSGIFAIAGEAPICEQNTPAELAVCSSTARYAGAGIFRDLACDQRIRGRGFAWLTPGGASPLRRIRDLAGRVSARGQPPSGIFAIAGEAQICKKESLRSSRYALPPRAAPFRDLRDRRRSPDLQTRKACGVRGMLFHRELRRLTASSAGSPRAPQAQPPRMLTARAATISTVTAAISDSMPMNSLARCDNGIASVGLNAIEFVTARYR